MRRTLFQKEPISTPLTTLHATLQPRQPTQRFRSVRIAYWVMAYSSPSKLSFAHSFRRGSVAS